MAQPCPAWEQIVKPAIMAVRAGSASSSMTKADLPPSSRNTFFTVSLAAAMIRRPTGVDPVKVTMSTIGSVTRASPTSTDDDVRTLTTPGGIVGVLGDDPPDRGGQPGAVGWPFQHDGAARGEGGHELGQGDLQRVVVGHDGGGDADRLLLDPAAVLPTPGLRGAEVLGELVAVEQVGVPPDHLDRRVQRGPTRGQHHRDPGLGHDQRTQVLRLGLEAGLQLPEAIGPGTPGPWPSPSCRRRAGSPGWLPGHQPAWRPPRCPGPPRCWG